MLKKLTIIDSKEKLRRGNTFVRRKTLLRSKAFSEDNK